MLLSLYKEGFVPGPSETFFDFSHRVNTVKKLIANPTTLAGHLKVPLEELTLISPGLLCFKSSKKLPFWFAAMTWICEFSGYTLPILQLPKKPSPFVTEEEVIEHEKVHALRSAFSEPVFEEILAYQTSKKGWRKFFGPLFRSPFESYALLALLFPPLFSPFFLILPMGFSLFYLLRLTKNQITFHLAKNFLRKNSLEPMKILPLLRDSEIKQLAKKKELEQLAKDTPRWQLIMLTIASFRDI